MGSEMCIRDSNVLMLADGTHTGGVTEIHRQTTIRALNEGLAVLDRGNGRRMHLVAASERALVRAVTHRSHASVAGNQRRRLLVAPTPQPLVHASIAMEPLMVPSSSHVTRRLTVIIVQPGAGTLQAALDGVSAGDELVLADGVYTGSGTNVLDIGKSVTIRAQNAGQAVLDGEDARRVVSITAGPVVLDGLHITRGYTSVRRPSSPATPRFVPLLQRPDGNPPLTRHD